MACVYWQYVNTSRGTVNMYLHSIAIHRPSPDASIIIIYVYKCYLLPRYRFHNISQCINVQKKPSPSPTSCPQIGRWSRCTKVTLGSRNMNSSDSYEHLEIDDKNLLVYIQSIRSPISMNSWNIPGHLSQAILHETISWSGWCSKAVWNRC